MVQGEGSDAEFGGDRFICGRVWCESGPEGWLDHGVAEQVGIKPLDVRGVQKFVAGIILPPGSEVWPSSVVEHRGLDVLEGLFYGVDAFSAARK